MAICVTETRGWQGWAGIQSPNVLSSPPPQGPLGVGWIGQFLWGGSGPPKGQHIRVTTPSFPEGRRPWPGGVPVGSTSPCRGGSVGSEAGLPGAGPAAVQRLREQSGWGLPLPGQKEVGESEQVLGHGGGQTWTRMGSGSRPVGWGNGQSPSCSHEGASSLGAPGHALGALRWGRRVRWG